MGALAGQPAHATEAGLAGSATEVRSLCGAWLFRNDPKDAGERQNWFSAEAAAADWRPVNVPHTWQIEAPLVDYRGRAWYRRTFDAPSPWQNSAVRVEFEAVFHSAKVWVNGQFAGEHARKGYTAFAFDITHLLRAGRPNVIAVRVDNAFNEDMLPRGRSSDWAHDGGIFRPVQLLVTPKVFLERADIDTFPDFSTGDARLEIAAFGRNTGPQVWKGTLSLRVVEKDTGLAVLAKANAAELTIGAGGTAIAKISVSLKRAKLWHFDHPHLYDLELSMTDARAAAHRLTSTFGVRKFEVKNLEFRLNGERVWLMGVERMGGSNPEFGMAEPESWTDHDHADLKNLNCVFTRVHWPQDRRVLDYCDRHGILIQTEVPTWGAGTFAGMVNAPSEVILKNGTEQLREMVARDRNHPCICSWGVCNEINGQNPPAYAFAKRMYEEAKKLDPNRLVSYASHSLFQTPGKDVARLMDFVMMNEYYGSWQRGTPADLARNLDEIHQAIPNKPIVISEYGYCACTADRPEGDPKRVKTLIEHDRVFRERDYVSGLIFFCYNDYRTHIGDRGMGVMKQRVHGVVDLFGARKASYEVLRTESSPVQSIVTDGRPKGFKLTVHTRRYVPAYTLRGYKLRGICYGYGDIPVETKEVELPELTAGQEATVSMAFAEGTPLRIQFDVLRPTGFSAYSREWKP
jgi:beta-galactosidase